MTVTAPTIPPDVPHGPETAATAVPAPSPRLTELDVLVELELLGRRQLAALTGLYDVLVELNARTARMETASAGVLDQLGPAVELVTEQLGPVLDGLHRGGVFGALAALRAARRDLHP